MCGVVGLLIRNRAIEAFLGEMLVTMIGALEERGPDSSGIALSSDPGRDQLLKVSLGSDEPVDWSVLRAELAGGYSLASSTFGPGLVVEVSETDEPALRTHLRESWPAVRVLATGWNLRVLKDTGSPLATCRRYDVGSWAGHLGIAHTRMATESAVTVLHSHPFVPMRDLCVVHNGSFSNHATVRRSLMAQGIEFDSDNDSEVAARFLAHRITAGDDLEEATRWVMKEMDGFFTLVLSTADELSVVRDAFACKPAVVAETDDFIAVASEYRALAELPGVAEARVFEPQPQEVYTWRR